MTDFVGVKIALLVDDKLVMILRDNKPDLRFAGMWDFPGGGREGSETPVECAMREVEEELLLKFPESSIVWQKEVESMHDPSLKAYFIVAKLSEENIKPIKLGEEGQEWVLMSVDDFFSRDDVVPKLKDRLRAYLSRDTIAKQALGSTWSLD